MFRTATSVCPVLKAGVCLNYLSRKRVGVCIQCPWSKQHEDVLIALVNPAVQLLQAAQMTQDLQDGPPCLVQLDGGASAAVPFQYPMLAPHIRPRLQFTKQNRIQLAFVLNWTPSPECCNSCEILVNCSAVHCQMADSPQLTAMLRLSTCACRCSSTVRLWPPLRTAASNRALPSASDAMSSTAAFTCTTSGQALVHLHADQLHQIY